MEELNQKLNSIEGVKSIERHRNVFKLKLFSRKISGAELYRIPGDLRKTSQQIRQLLDSFENIQNWEWNVKPEKKYRDQSFKDSSVSDREPKGYNRNYYEITVVK